MRLSRIMLSSNPKGQFLEGAIGDTSLPGTIMMVQPGVAFSSNRPTYVAAAPGTAAWNGQCAVLLEDMMQGFLFNQAYVIGTRCRLYVPYPGEEINVLCGEPSGTGISYTIGQTLELAAAGGILIPSTTNMPLFVCMEAIHVTGQGLVFVSKM